MGEVEDRIKSKGITLPAPSRPAGSYASVHFLEIGYDHIDCIAYVSGQIPIRDGEVAYRGSVSDANLEAAKKSAELSMLNVLSQLDNAIREERSGRFYTDYYRHGLNSVTEFVMLSGRVNSAPGFVQHHKVMDAASDLLLEIMGECGRQHARAVAGASSLPFDAMTEISAVVRTLS